MPAAASSRRSSRRLRARIGPMLPTGIRSSADTPAVAQLGGHQQRQQGAVTGRQPVQRRLRPVVPVPGGDELFRRPVRGGGIRVGQPPPAWGPAQAPRAPSRAAGAASSAATNPPGPGPAASPGAPPGAAARELLTAQQAGMAPEVLAGGSRRRWATRWPCWNCPRSVTAASPSSRCASGDGWNTRSGDGSRRCRHPPARRCCWSRRPSRRLGTCCPWRWRRTAFPPPTWSPPRPRGCWSASAARCAFSIRWCARRCANRSRLPSGALQARARVPEVAGHLAGACRAPRERARRVALAPFEHAHRTPRLGQPAGDDRAAGSRPDHYRVDRFYLCISHLPPLPALCRHGEEAGKGPADTSRGRCGAPGVRGPSAGPG